MLTTPHLNGAGTAFVWFARRFFEVQADAFGLRRIQMHVHNDAVTAVRFARALEFRPEGLLKHYGPNGEDMILLARLYP